MEDSWNFFLKKDKAGSQENELKLKMEKDLIDKNVRKVERQEEMKEQGRNVVQ